MREVDVRVRGPGGLARGQFDRSDSHTPSPMLASAATTQSTVQWRELSPRLLSGAGGTVGVRRDAGGELTSLGSVGNGAGIVAA